jgi:hypothetical protein
MITEHASVVLTADIAASGLQAGDVGVVIHIHRDAAGRGRQAKWVVAWLAEGRKMEDLMV